MQEEEAKANEGTQIEDEDDDDDDDVEDDDDDVLKSPVKKKISSKKKRVVGPADARLAVQLCDQRMTETEMLEKTEELLQKHTAKVFVHICVCFDV